METKSLRILKTLPRKSLKTAGSTWTLKGLSQVKGILKSNLSRISRGVFQISLGVIFIASGLMKIVDVEGFQETVKNYQILTDPLLTLLVATTLPWLELICGILLVFRKWEKANLAIVVGLNLVFIVALTTIWIRGIDIGCGCFSKTPSTTGPFGLDARGVAIARDMLFIAMACTVWRLGENEGKKS